MFPNCIFLPRKLFEISTSIMGTPGQEVRDVVVLEGAEAVQLGCAEIGVLKGWQFGH